MSLSNIHFPRLLQSLGQTAETIKQWHLDWCYKFKSYYLPLWQANPSNPSKHWHVPEVRSQIPAFEHSAFLCAESIDIDLSVQAISSGHVPTIQL